MEPPRYTAAELADYIRICQGDRAPVTLGVGIYQDGTIGEESFPVLQQFRRLVRNRPATGQTTCSTTILPRTEPPPRARLTEARRVGNERVSECRSRWQLGPSTQTHLNKK